MEKIARILVCIFRNIHAYHLFKTSGTVNENLLYPQQITQVIFFFYAIKITFANNIECKVKEHPPPPPHHHHTHTPKTIVYISIFIRSNRVILLKTMQQVHNLQTFCTGSRCIWIYFCLKNGRWIAKWNWLPHYPGNGGLLEDKALKNQIIVLMGMIKSVLPLSIHLRNVFEISMTSRNNASYVTSVSKTRFATFCSFFSFSSDSSLRSFKVKLYKNDSNLKNRQPLIVNQEKNTFLIVFFSFAVAYIVLLFLLPFYSFIYFISWRHGFPIVYY